MTAELPVRRAPTGARGPARGPRRRAGARWSRSTSAWHGERAPHLVTLVGEAGVGKSRLLRELERDAGGTPGRARLLHRAAASPYGSGIVFWALGEVIRAGCGIVDTDSAEQAWEKLLAHTRAARVETTSTTASLDEEGMRKTALLGRLIGLEVPRRARARRARTPSALRECVLLGAALRHRGLGAPEAAGVRLRGHPLGRRRHARRDRAPRAMGARARCCSSASPATSCSSGGPGWGGGRRNATQLFLEPLTPDGHRELVARAASARASRSCRAVVERSGGNPLFAEEMARRIAEERRRARGRAAGHRAGRAGRPARRARARSSGAWCSRPRSSGRTFWEGSLAPPRGGRGPRPRPHAARAAGQGHPRARRRGPPGRRARAGLQARADPRRGLRDAAQGGALAEALRGRQLHRGARGRPQRRGRGAARRALRPRRRAGTRGRRARSTSSTRCATARCASSRRPATPRRCSTRTARPPPTTATPARSAPAATRRVARPHRREARRRVAAARPRRRGDRGLARVPRLPPRPGGPRARGRPAPQDRRRASRTRASASRHRALPEGHQPAEGRPAAPRAGAAVRGGRLALPAHRRQHARHLRLREGAAAGRAARRDARGQPRPRDLRPRVRPHRRHREGAPEPRARGRAGARLRPRRDDPRAVGARPAPRGLGGRRGRRRARPTRRRWRWPSRWASCPPRSSCTPSLAQLAVVPRRLGAGRARPPRRAPSWPSARASWASSALPYALRGLLRWRDGELGEATVLFHRAHELAEQVGWSELAFQALFGLAIALRDRGDLDRRRDGARPALDVCERAGPDRPVDPGDRRARRDPRPGRPPRRPREAAARGRPSWPSACTTRSAAPPRWRRRA